LEDPLRGHLGLRLGAAWRRLDRLCNRAYGAMELTHAHAQVLLCVLDRGEVRMADVVPLTGLTQSTVSRLAADLSHRRYLRRRPDPADGRSQLLAPSRRTLRIGPDLRRIRDQLEEDLRRDLVGADPDALRALLDLIAPSS